ncbi:MAG: hypothetical protein ISS78_10205 [Phycisphaerae bacterium]|nr:hypothetical protein [Phycisphaerae bacterium]
MSKAYHTIILSLAAVLLGGCLEPEPGRGLNQSQKLWVAGEDREKAIGEAIAAGTWVGMTRGQLEDALREDIFEGRLVDFSYRRPDTDLFGAQYDEALVIHRPLRFDDVWVLFRDDKVAHVAAIFIE